MLESIGQNGALIVTCKQTGVCSTIQQHLYPSWNPHVESHMRCSRICMACKDSSLVTKACNCCHASDIVYLEKQACKAGSAMQHMQLHLLPYILFSFISMASPRTKIQEASCPHTDMLSVQQAQSKGQVAAAATKAICYLAVTSLPLALMPYSATSLQEIARTPGLGHHFSIGHGALLGWCISSGHVCMLR